jgi:hypothetical protein
VLPHVSGRGWCECSGHRPIDKSTPDSKNYTPVYYWHRTAVNGEIGHGDVSQCEGMKSRIGSEYRVCIIQHSDPRFLLPVMHHKTWSRTLPSLEVKGAGAAVSRATAAISYLYCCVWRRQVTPMHYACHVNNKQLSWEILFILFNAMFYAGFRYWAMLWRF